MSQFADQLKTLLKQDISDLNNLTSLLELEKETLKTRNSSEIESIAKQKSTVVQTLEARSKLKARSIARSGLGIRPGQVEKSLSALDDAELLQLWQSSQKKLAHCKDRNQVNGGIIAQSLQRTNRLMTIIRGQHNAPNLYGQQGKAKSYTDSHKIGSA
jgi:flagella synthesis protein FlgN